MSFLWVLGTLDIIAVLIVFLYAVDVLPWNFLLGCIIYLFAKNAVFHKDIVSYLDGAVAVILVLLLFGIHNNYVLLVCILFLSQKALRSFI